MSSGLETLEIKRVDGNIEVAVKLDGAEWFGVLCWPASHFHPDISDRELRVMAWELLSMLNGVLAGP